MTAWPHLGELIVDAGVATKLGLLGAPLANGSVSPGRCDEAPELLRQTLRRIGRYDVETRSELSTLIADHGDLALAPLSVEEATGPIREAAARSMTRHELTLLIGGNNAITRPGVLGANSALDRIGLITLDAHLDMRDLADGLGNGNPVRALIEDGLPGMNIAQVGLAPFANTRRMHEDALGAGNLVLTMEDVRRHGVNSAVLRALEHVRHCELIYVDCDIDVIDRSQFPGAPGARPGGMAAVDFFAAVRRLAAEPNVRAIDLTEWDPSLDSSDLSALTAARWVAECVAGFELRTRRAASNDE